jgi:large subunit ribosomal protein L15
MVISKRKKVVKYRGHTTHGGGHRKKRRGAGNRGGRGRAGSGKRAATRKQSYRITGRSGFLPRGKKKEGNIINLSKLQQQLSTLTASGKVERKGDKYIINLHALGYDKLLGSGNISVAIEVTAGSVSAKAAEKIIAAGGNVPEERANEEE